MMVIRLVLQIKQIGKKWELAVQLGSRFTTSLIHFMKHIDKLRKLLLLIKMCMCDAIGQPCDSTDGKAADSENKKSWD